MPAEPTRARTILPPPGEVSMDAMLRAITTRPEPPRREDCAPPEDNRPTVPCPLLPGW